MIECGGHIDCPGRAKDETSSRRNLKGDARSSKTALYLPLMLSVFVGAEVTLSYTHYKILLSCHGPLNPGSRTMLSLHQKRDRTGCSDPHEKNNGWYCEVWVGAAEHC